MRNEITPPEIFAREIMLAAQLQVSLQGRLTKRPTRQIIENSYPSTAWDGILTRSIILILSGYRPILYP
jgi:hypothetical protein